MTAAQLAQITDTTKQNVNLKYKPYLTVIKPFPANHSRPSSGRESEFIVCDWRLRRLLNSLRDNGKGKDKGLDPLEIAKQNFDFIR